MSAIPDTAVPSFPHGVRFREDTVRGQFILVGPERIFNADAVAVEILKRIDGRRTFRDLIDALTAVFTADEATIRPDVESFLGDLADKQMVVL